MATAVVTTASAVLSAMDDLLGATDAAMRIALPQAADSLNLDGITWFAKARDAHWDEGRLTWTWDVRGKLGDVAATGYVCDSISRDVICFACTGTEEARNITVSADYANPIVYWGGIPPGVQLELGLAVGGVKKWREKGPPALAARFVVSTSTLDAFEDEWHARMMQKLMVDARLYVNNVAEYISKYNSAVKEWEEGTAPDGEVINNLNEYWNKIQENAKKALDVIGEIDQHRQQITAVATALPLRYSMVSYLQQAGVTIPGYVVAKAPLPSPSEVARRERKKIAAKMAEEERKRKEAEEKLEEERVKAETVLLAEFNAWKDELRKSLLSLAQKINARKISRAEKVAAWVSEARELVLDRLKSIGLVYDPVRDMYFVKENSLLWRLGQAGVLRVPTVPVKVVAPPVVKPPAAPPAAPPVEKPRVPGAPEAPPAADASRLSEEWAGALRDFKRRLEEWASGLPAAVERPPAFPEPPSQPVGTPVGLAQWARYVVDYARWLIEYGKYLNRLKGVVVFV